MRQSKWLNVIRPEVERRGAKVIPVESAEAGQRLAERAHRDGFEVNGLGSLTITIARKR